MSDGIDPIFTDAPFQAVPWCEPDVILFYNPKEIRTVFTDKDGNILLEDPEPMPIGAIANLGFDK